VAAGKSTISAAVADHLRSTLKIEVISTDGFLFPNDVLAARGLSLRKGYPETYDLGLLSGVVQRARWGAVRVPGYSHTTYDRAPELDRTITRPEILLVEGLGFSLNANQRSSAALLDLLIYVDADEALLEEWFVKRFLDHWRAAETHPASFYARFRNLSESETAAFARQVWVGINLPNLRDNIAPLKQQADILVEKSHDHALRVTLSALGHNS
jgi:type I pantothenate kinase